MPDHLHNNEDAIDEVDANVQAYRAEGVYQSLVAPVTSDMVSTSTSYTDHYVIRNLTRGYHSQRGYCYYLLDRVIDDSEYKNNGMPHAADMINGCLDTCLEREFDGVWTPEDGQERPGWALWRAVNAFSANTDTLEWISSHALSANRGAQVVQALQNALGTTIVGPEKGQTHKFAEALSEHSAATEYVYCLEGLGKLDEASPEGLKEFEQDRKEALKPKEEVNEGRLAQLRELRTRLMSVQPDPINHSDIGVQLGSAWLPPSVVMSFMEQVFELDPYVMEEAERKHWTVTHDTVTGKWRVTGSSKSVPGSIKRKYGTEKYPCFKLVESLLNGSQLRCTKPDPNDPTKHIADPVETARAWHARELVDQAFKQWVWKDADRTALLEKLYNKRFNRTVLRKYDGSILKFPGLTEGITLRKHQANAVARVLQSTEGTLLGHVVGAGKTFGAVVSMHEAKRLGRATKPMAVVPNHLTGQFASEWLRLYPDAKLLVMNDADTRTPAAAQRFWGRARGGDWDAIIVGHSRFSKLSLSPEIQEQATKRRLEELENSIESELEATGKHSFTVKAQEGLKKQLEGNLKRLQDKTGKAEEGVNFDDLGVDMLVVDESHNFKNLAVTGAQVAGMAVSGSGKCEDLLYKCDWLRQQGKGSNIVFMTGTPVTNTMGELYNLERYLAPDTLKKTGTSNFSDWALTYGHLEETMEVRPEGGGFQSKMRFTRFQNLPELMKTYHSFADIITQDMVDLDLPTLKKANIAIDPEPTQKAAMDLLVERASRIRDGVVDPRIDNMLKITSDGRKIALDPMLMQDLGVDKPLDNGKVQKCAENIYDIWQKGTDKKTTQLVFCDSSTDAGKKGFNIYDDLRRRLHDLGIPDDQVASVGDVGNSKARREQLFERVDSGDVRVLIGSTETLGTGTNVQSHLVAIHDLDCPWRPSDLEQRLGRIVRQGNQNGIVYDYRYVTKGTFDAYMYQTVERKQRFIAQTFTSKTPARSVDDLDQVQLDYAEVKALATGDPAVAKVLGLENEVKQLELSRRAWSEGQNEIAQSIQNKLLPQVKVLQKRYHMLEDHQGAFKKANGIPSYEKDAAEQFSKKMLDTRPPAGKEIVGEYRGMNVVMDSRPALILGDAPTRYIGLIPKDENDLTRAHMAKNAMPLNVKGPHTPLRQLNSIIETDCKGTELVADDLKKAEDDLNDAQHTLEQPWENEKEYLQKSGELKALRDMIKPTDKNNVQPEEDTETKRIDEDKVPEQSETYGRSVVNQESPSAADVRASVRAARNNSYSGVPSQSYSNVIKPY